MSQKPITVEVTQRTKVVLSHEEALAIATQVLENQIVGIGGADSWWLRNNAVLCRMDDYGHHRGGEIIAEIRVASQTDRVIARALVEIGAYKADQLFK